MIDGATLTIIPPIITSILAYAVAIKKSKLAQAKVITEIQLKALEVVSSSEQKMREEMRR